MRTRPGAAAPDFGPALTYLQFVLSQGVEAKPVEAAL